MKFDFCPKCGFKLTDEYNFCPKCSFNLSGEGNADDISETPHKAVHDKLRVLIIRGKYDEAKTLCDTLLDDAPMDKMGYVNLIRIASKNYKEYENEEISEQIRIAEEIFSGTEELLTDPEYAKYVSARNAYFEEKERKRKQEEEAAKIRDSIVLEKAAEEQPDSNLKLKDNGDGTYTVTGVRGRKSNIKSVIIPNNVTTIGENAFLGCKNLKNITIPESLKEIGDDSFEDCDELIIYYNGDVAGWCAINGLINLPDVPLYIKGKELVGKLVIPDGVTTIGDYAFYGCSGLTSIIIPDSVTSIGDYAFFDCSGLKSITIGNSVTSIGDWAFLGCSSLTSITIPNSVTSIGNGAFDGCRALKNIIIPNSVTTIGELAFVGCSGLTSIIIPKSVMSIGSEAFYYCSILTIYCEADSQPDGWHENWNPDNRPVVWGYKKK